MIVGAAVPLAWSRPAALAMADRGFRTINFDYSGGTGQEGTPEPRTCLQQVDDVLEVLSKSGSNAGAAVGPRPIYFLTPPGSVVRVERDQEEVVGDEEVVAAPTLIVSGGKDQVVNSGTSRPPSRSNPACRTVRVH